MGSYVLGFQEIDKTKVAITGGKGANLGELSRIQGIQVPQGFCVTTEAYREVVSGNQEWTDDPRCCNCQRVRPACGRRRGKRNHAD